MAWIWPRNSPAQLARYANPDVYSYIGGIPQQRFDLGRRATATAVYDVLRNRDKPPRYALEKYFAERNQQSIRSPREVLDSPREGTCLDLALLYCGACLGAELYPLLLVTRNHALAAVSMEWDIRTHVQASRIAGMQNGLLMSDRREFLVEQARVGKYVIVECTGFAEYAARGKGTLDFDAAAAAGLATLEVSDLAFGVDLVAQQVEWGYAPEPLEWSGSRQVQIMPVPSYYVRRNKVHDSIREALGSPGVVAIYGMPGLGKSTLAAAVAREAEKQFPGGVLWTTLGAAQASPAEAEAAAKNVLALIENKKTLLVVDDVWRRSDAALYLTGGPDVHVLITTRMGIVASVAENRFEPEVLSSTESVELMSGRLARSLTPEETEQAKILAQRVGYLPLALDLAAALIEYGQSWDDLIAAFEEEVGRLEALDQPGADEEPEYARKRVSLEASFQLSLRGLSASDRDAFSWLGVIAEDSSITAAASAKLWGVNESRARERLVVLRERGLLLAGAPDLEGRRTWRMHDLVRNTARAELTRTVVLSDAHRELLVRWKPPTGNWTDCPDDGYFPDHLALHLEKAGLLDELEQLLVQESPTQGNAWFERREGLGQVNGYTADLARMSRLHPGELRWSLMRASVNSLAAKTPGKIGAALVRKQVWTIRQAIGSVRHIANWRHQLWELVELGAGSEGAARQEVGRELLAFSDDPERLVGALAAFAPHWPEELIFEAAALAGKLPASSRAQVLCSLLPRFAALEYPIQVRSIANEFAGKEELTTSLRQAAHFLAAEELDCAIAFVKKSATPPYGGEDALASFAIRLAETGRGPESLALLEELKEDRWRSTAIRGAAQYLASEWQRLAAAARMLGSSENLAVALAAIEAAAGPASNLTRECARAISNARNTVETLKQVLTILPPRALERTSFFILPNDENIAVIAAALARAGEGERALEWIADIDDESEYRRREALVDAMPHLPEVLVRKVLAARDEMKDRNNREHLTAAICRRLAQLGAGSEALDLAKDIEESYPREEALAGMAEYLNVPLLRQALALGRRIHDSDGATHALAAFVSDLPEAEQRQLVQIAQTLPEWQPRIDLLAQFAPELTPDVRDEMIAWIEACEDEEWKVRGKLALAPAMPHYEKLLAAFEAIRVGWAFSAKLWFMRKLLPLIPACGSFGRTLRERIRDEAWALANQLDDEGFVVLAAILVEVDDWKTIDEKIRALEHPRDRVTGLRTLAQFHEERERKAAGDEMESAYKVLKEAAIRDAIEIAASIQNPYTRCDLFAEIAPWLSGDIAERELPTAENDRSASRLLVRMVETGRATKAVARARDLRAERDRLPVFAAAGLIKDAIGEFVLLEDASEASTSVLVDAILKLPDLEIRQYWDMLVPLLVTFPREGCLNAIARLAPVLRRAHGQAACLATFRAIRQTTKWWP